MVFYTILTNSFVLPAHPQMPLSNVLPIPVGLTFDRFLYFQAPVLLNALSHHPHSQCLLKPFSSLTTVSSRFHLFLHSLHSFPPQPI